MADEIAKTNKHLSEAVIEANAANRAKSEFLATMSHDLRTPLNAIIGFSEAIRQEIYGPVGNSKYHEYLDDISKSGHILLSLINYILDLSKIEAGRYELQETDDELPGFLEYAVDLAAVQARQNSVGLELSVAPDLPLLRCDQRSLLQIVNNLLSNAVKYSNSGGRVSVTARQTADGAIEIEFADHGIGIREQDLHEVFQPFGQVYSSKSRKNEGTGLGLPICLKLMELHGGRLEIKSELGRGTVVIIAFPADRVIAPSSAAGGTSELQQTDTDGAMFN
ncbi:MAG: HAMP domain-containing sensor histidine kinase [Alphaproteobacteria bacterium]